MGNFIIENRIKKLELEKQRLLKLKKRERQNQVKEIESTINRLRKWNFELSQPTQKNQVTTLDEIRRKKEQKNNAFCEYIMTKESKDGKRTPNKIQRMFQNIIGNHSFSSVIQEVRKIKSE